MQQLQPIGVLIITLFIGFAVSAPVRGDDTETAKDEYHKGVAAFELKEYDVALAHFTESYNLSGKPGILYNLAVCQEKLGQTDRAIAYYELYLEEVPDAEDQDAVRKKVAVLKNPDAVAEESDAAKKDPAPAPEPSKEVSQKENAANVPSGPLQAEIPPDPNADRYNLMQGLLIGGGTLLLVTGGLTTVAAFRKHSSYETVCAPNCSDSQVTTVKRLALAADIQMGLGMVALASGIIWKIVYRKKRAKIESRGMSALSIVPTGDGYGGGLFVLGRF